MSVQKYDSRGIPSRDEKTSNFDTELEEIQFPLNGPPITNLNVKAFDGGNDGNFLCILKCIWLN